MLISVEFDPFKEELPFLIEHGSEFESWELSKGANRQLLPRGRATHSVLFYSKLIFIRRKNTLYNNEEKL